MLKILSNKTKKIIYIVVVILIIVLFMSLIYLTIDGKKITNIKEFIRTGTKVLYVTEDEKLDYPIKILDKYSVEYLQVNSDELTIFERKKVKNIVNSKYIKNLLIIYKNGVIEDVLIEYKNNKSVEKFLQNNNIIPEELVDNVEEIVKNTEKILENNYAMIYLPYKNSNDIEKQNQIFEEISKKYSIDYKKIDAYLLSNNQQEKINSLLGLSLVENQILVLIKDNKMIANIRGVHSKNTYIKTLYDVKFIDEIENKVNEIDYNTYKNLLKNSEKSIILIATNNKDSNDVINALNKIIYNYNIDVNYIIVDNSDDYLYNKVKEKLDNVGYSGSFSLPLVVIVESNKIIDYVIGNSKEDYFVDIFIENGVIKGDVINE